MIELYPHQKKAVEQLKNGCILCGGVGTGKSLTALCYYVQKVLGQDISALAKGFSFSQHIPLYIITTARKRDTKDWEKEAEPFGLQIRVDSWNNITKYINVSDAMFIFDEQRIIGSGVWVKSFLKIARRNQWILLSATPGDTWMDYIPVFVANGFYRNRSDFLYQHVIYSRFSKYPKVDGYLDTPRLMAHRKEIVVNMVYKKQTVPHQETVFVPFSRQLVRDIYMTRWNPFDMCPIQDAGALCYVLRKAVNGDERRILAVKDILKEHPKAVLFYNFNYELDMLRQMAQDISIACAEWNGHKHEPIPEADKWIYLVQYTAGCEGWNCVETDTMIFYSLNYSYKVMTQAAGRIDRLNTPFTDLYYYQLLSRSGIDLAIRKAIQEKRNFNESLFAGKR